MHPVLFRLGDFPVTAYGFALTLAFVAGIMMARLRARGRGVPDAIVVETSIVIFIAAMLGSRVLFALESPEQFRPPHGSWLDLVLPWLKSGSLEDMSGLSMSAGVAVAAAAAAAFVRLRGQPVLPTLDLLAPSVPLGAGITRLGCFLNGCCFGRACDAPWGVTFPPGSLAARSLGEVAIHPTQLYASLSGFALCAALLWLARRPERQPGLIVFTFLTVTGVSRLVIDGFRHYPADDALSSGLWMHQPFVLAVMGAGVAGLMGCAVRARRKGLVEGG